MENKKQYCENLYSKYKELKRKTDLEAHDTKPRGEIKAKYIDIKAMEERIKIKEELHACLNLLTDEQLKELYDDPDFIEKVVKILAERRTNNQSILDKASYISFIGNS